MAGIITIVGAMVTSALTVVGDGPVADALTIVAAGLTAAGTIFGVYQVTNRPKG